MKRSRSTILSMASTRQSRNSAVVNRAVDNLVGGRDGVGQDVGFAVAVDIAAVVLGAARGDGAALACDGAETGSDG